MARKLKKMQVFLIFTIIVASISMGLWLYNGSLQVDLRKYIFTNLEEIMQQQRFNFVSEINAEIQAIKSVAKTISVLDSPLQEVLDTNSYMMKETNFERLTVCGLDGMGVSNKGEIVDVSSRDFYQQALKGTTVFSSPFQSHIRNATVIALATPIYRDGSIVGVLVGTYDTAMLNNLFLPSFGGDGYAFVVDRTGVIVAHTTSDYTVTNEANLIESFRNRGVFKAESSLESLLQNMSLGQSGQSSYEIDKQKRLMSYAPLGINDWYIFTIVPEDVIAKQSDIITQKAGVLTGVMAVVFLGIFLYLTWVEKKTQKMQEAHIAELTRMAYVDELTGARNFQKFKEDAEEILQNNPQILYTFVKIDVDNFKLINEIYGFSEGNRILQNIALSLQDSINAQFDIFGRINADEFIILFRSRNLEALRHSKEVFRKRFYERMGSGFVFKIKFPSGLYTIEPGETDVSDIFEKVNYAHRFAKQSMDDMICFYDGSIKENALQEKQIENRMETALENHEFKVFFQPKYTLLDETVHGVEALVRWQTGNGETIYPNVFIPIFEKNGFITKLDYYMLEESCKIIRSWLEDGLAPVGVSVNLSRLHLNNPNLIEDICTLVDRYRVPRKLIELELTESALYENEEILVEFLDKLHNKGFTLSMDDFGSGYSSLGLLKNLSVDVLKLDRGFFVNSRDEHSAEVVISSVLDMAKKLGVRTVAEGVETKAQVEYLKDLGCDSVQGYYYARPMPAEEFTKKRKEGTY